MRGGLKPCFIVYCHHQRLDETISPYPAKASNLVAIRESAKHADARKAHSEHPIPAEAIASTAVQLLLLLLLVLVLLLLLLLGLLLLLLLLLLLSKRICSAGADLSGHRRSWRIDGGRIKGPCKG